MNLARFRADPARVRVRVRQSGGVYAATIESRDQAPAWSVMSRSVDPKRAVSRALAKADGLPGVDVGMECAYPHPFGKSDS